jgi:hypothetical protein
MAIVMVIVTVERNGRWWWCGCGGHVGNVPLFAIVTSGGGGDPMSLSETAGAPPREPRKAVSGNGGNHVSQSHNNLVRTMGQFLYLLRGTIHGNNVNVAVSDRLKLWIDKGKRPTNSRWQQNITTAKRGVRGMAS